MALFDSVRGWLARRGKTGGFSSPERTLHAAGVLERNGRSAEASVILAEGVRRFPKSTALRAQQERLESRRLRERIAELTRSLQGRPDPALALELVRIYRQVGEAVSARRVAAEAIEKFPKFAPLHRITGELFMEIFEQSGTTQDGSVAIRSLEQCIVLDPSNVPAREALVVLYGKIGAWTRVMEHTVKMLGSLRPDLVGRLALEALVQRKLPPDDVDGLLRRFSRSLEKTIPSAQGKPEEEKWARVLAAFQDLKGRRLAAVVTPDGTVREAVGNERTDKAALAKGVNGLKAAATKCCSRMSIGGFVMAQLETPDAAAYLKILPAPGGDASESGVWRMDALFLLTSDAARRREALARLELV